MFLYRIRWAIYTCVLILIIETGNGAVAIERLNCALHPLCNSWDNQQRVLTGVYNIKSNVAFSIQVGRAVSNIEWHSQQVLKNVAIDTMHPPKQITQFGILTFNKRPVMCHGIESLKSIQETHDDTLDFSIKLLSCSGVAECYKSFVAGCLDGENYFRDNPNTKQKGKPPVRRLK